jgi:hypothetical protein
MPPRTGRLFIVIVGLTLLGCAPTTKLASVWKDPATTGPIRFTKTLVACQSADQTFRRAVEDRLAARIRNATPSYTLFAGDKALDIEQVKTDVKAAGFDGAVVMRLVGTDTRTAYIPGGPAPYGTMWNQWGYGWGVVYQPGYLQENKVVTLESTVYSITDEKLLWASRSDTLNPQSVSSLVDAVVDATVKEMKQQKVL